MVDVAASCSDKLLQFSRREQQVRTVQTVHFRGVPTGAALGQGCRARCVQRQCPGPDAHNSGGAAVAVPRQGVDMPVVVL